MKLQTTIITILISLLLTFSGCSNDAEPIIKDKQVSATSGEKVDLVASSADSYSWLQLSGVSVILINANRATLSFIAPDVDQVETLVFEVQAIMGDISIRKERATVIVHPLDVLSDDNIPPDTNTTVLSDNNIITPIDTNITLPTNPLKSIALTISNNSLNIDTNTSLNAVATYEDKTTKDITDEVEWIGTDLNAIQISKHQLKAKKETNIILQAKLNAVISNAVALEIYKEINGHRLPPEPNKIINDSTLLGIDSNNNGVRDDVERYVIIRFSKEDFPKTRTALAMQYAWAKQKIIESPTRESAKYSHDAIDCQYYWFDKKQEVEYQQFSEILKTDRRAAAELDSKLTKWRLKYKVFNEDGINNIIFNTRERTKQDFTFNGAMNGGFFPGRDESLDNCQVNIDLFGE